MTEEKSQSKALPEEMMTDEHRERLKPNLASDAEEGPNSLEESKYQLSDFNKDLWTVFHFFSEEAPKNAEGVKNHYQKSIEMEGLVRRMAKQRELMEPFFQNDPPEGMDLIRRMMRTRDTGGRLRNLALDILSDNLPLTKEHWIFPEALKYLVEERQATREKALPYAREFIRSGMEESKEEQNPTNTVFFYGRDLISSVIKYGNEEDFEEFLPPTIADWRKTQKKGGSEFTIKDILLDKSHPEISAKAFKLITGLDETQKEKIFRAWEASFNPKLNERSIDVFELNTRAIAELEVQLSGSTKILFEEFGIADFARYPTEILINQVKERKEVYGKYGVVIFPRDDWNGAFYDDKQVLANLYQQLKGQYGLRIVEADGKREVARRLISLDKRYHQKGGRKIGFMILGGHGTSDSIQFGAQSPNSIVEPARESSSRTIAGVERPNLASWSKNHTLLIYDLNGYGLKKTKKFFEWQAPIILASCSTGQKYGIGEKMSRILETELIAPNEPANIESISFQYVDRQPEFKVKYTKNVPTKEYSSGWERTN